MSPEKEKIQRVDTRKRKMQSKPRKMSSSPNICDTKQVQKMPEERYQHYEVQSCLHRFCEDCTASIWEHGDDFQILRSLHGWSSIVWKVRLTSGTVFLISGVISDSGLSHVPQINVFGEGHFVMMDSQATEFNGALDFCKMSGALLFSIGGKTMATGILMSAFAKSYPKEEKCLQQKFKDRIADIKPTTKSPGPGETKIPRRNQDI